MRALYRRGVLILGVLSGLFLSACHDDVPEMHRGRRFYGSNSTDVNGHRDNRYSAGQELEPHVLGPGRYAGVPRTYMYLIDCAPKTMVSPLSFTTKDQKVLWLNIYTRIGVNCSDAALKRLVVHNSTFANDDGKIGPDELYTKLVHQAVAQAVEELITAYASYELDAKAGVFLTGVQIRTQELLKQGTITRAEGRLTVGNTSEFVNVEVEDIANRDSPVVASFGRAMTTERQRVLANGAAAALESVQAELREEQTLLETANARKARLQAENETAELERKLEETKSAERASALNGVLSILWTNVALLVTLLMVIGMVVIGTWTLPPAVKSYMANKAENERIKRIARTEEAAIGLITLLKLDRELARDFHKKLGHAIEEESEPPNAA